MKRADVFAERLRMLELVLNEESDPGTNANELGPRERAGPVPLSPAQQRLWFVDQFTGGSAYSIPFLSRLTGVLDAGALERAIGEVVRRHEVLRTVFPARDGVPEQIVMPWEGFILAREDLGSLPPAAREDAMLAAAAEALARPFDLANGPLLRALLLRLGAEAHVLVVVVHHIVSDGWSLNVLMRELAAAYPAFCDGRAPPLPDLALQYADYAIWQRERMDGEAERAELAWWSARLAGAPARLELPPDHARPAVQSFRGAVHGFVVDAGLRTRLETLARGERATLFMVLLAAWQSLLARYAGEDDVVVGTPIAGRTRQEIESLIGCFVNVLPLRTDCSGDPSFLDLLRRVREVTFDAYQHQELPFERLVEALGVDRDVSHTPVFQSLFVLQNTPDDVEHLGAVRVGPVPLPIRTAKYEVSLSVSEYRGRLWCALEYATDLFLPSTAERIGRQWTSLLEGAAADPGARLSSHSLLTPAERRQVLDVWSTGPAAGGRVPTSVVDRIVAHAARRPEAVAVACAGETLSFGALVGGAVRLGGVLRASGVAPERPVAILVEPSPDLAVALLGVMHAGGACVTLDPSAPPARIAAILANCGITTAVVAAELRIRIPAGVVCVAPDASAPEVSAAPRQVPGPHALACLIPAHHGAPRQGSALVGHGPVNRLLEAWLACGSMRPGEAVGVLDPHALPLGGIEILLTLAAGGPVYVAAAEDAAGGPRLGPHHPGLCGCLVASAAVWGTLASRGWAGGGVRVLNAGEPLPVAVAAALAERSGGVWNLWSPPEAAGSVLGGRVDGADRPPTPRLRPLTGARALVLDGAMGPVAAGVPGELFLGGDGVAWGYQGEPARTAERFVPDPHAATPGSRLHRTGVRARWIADGALEYLRGVAPRLKVRGRRVDPAEVERALLRHPAVEACAVEVRDDPHGMSRLVAYCAGGEPAPAAALRRHAREHLAEAMVPDAFVALTALPRLPAGGVDRAALPEPVWSGGGGGSDPARTPTENALAAIWAEVLGIRPGRDDGFFELGGQSLVAIRLAARVRTGFGIDLSIPALFAAPTLAAMARYVDQATLAARPADAPDAGAIPRADRTRPLPLSYGQQQLWLLDRMHPGDAAYNVPLLLHLRGPLDTDSLERAVRTLVHRHDALRTTFAAADGVPVQAVAPANGWRLPREDVLPAHGERPAAALRRHAAAEAARPFDLGAGPTFRVRLFRAAAGEHALTLCMHHAVADEWSVGILLRELGACYAAYREGRDPALPDLPVQYPDFAVWQRRQLDDRVLEKLADYWRAALSGASPRLELPTDRPPPAVASRRGAAHGFAVDRAAAQRLQRLARDGGATPFMVLLAGWQLFLARYSGQHDVIVGVPHGGRPRPELDGVVGFFANLLPLRADVSGSPTFRELTARVRHTALEAQRHQALPFERIVEVAGAERSAARNPLVQVGFSYHAALADAGPQLPGLMVETWEPPVESAKFDLTLHAFAENDALTFTLEYATDLFDAATAARMGEHLTVLLSAAAADPDRPVMRLPLVAPAERQALLQAPNREARCVADARCVHERVAEHAARRPGAVAVSDGEIALTYAELDARGNQLAHHLRALGVRPGARVGIFMERSADLVLALLGIFKAGAAYVPLDPANPGERLAGLLADSGATHLVTGPDVPAEGAAVLSAAAAAALPVLRVDRSGDGFGGWPQTAPPSGAGPADPAYVMYTSGSTGRPKGVVVTHANVARLFAAAQPWFDFGPADVWTLFHSFAFDFSVWEIWGALVRGGRLVVVPYWTSRSPDAFRALVARERVTVLNQTPSAFRQFVHADETAPAGAALSLRHVVFGGEALDVPSVRRWFARHGEESPRLVNMYGITETTVHVTGVPLTGSLLDAALPGTTPIGLPIPDLRVYVLDAAGEPPPAGVAGEIHVGGAGVACGYLNRPGLTAERFVPDPFGGAGGRLYRSGDLGRQRADGSLDYLGRADGQVKIRGFRVELGEVEAALAAEPGVRGVAVLARETAGGARQLVAYVVPGPAGTDAAALRRAAGERLPPYMAPAAYAILDALPLTPQGKLDRRALPAPEPPSREMDAYAPPASALEEALAEVWSRVLGVPEIGVTEDFFAAGGDSLLAVQMVSALRERGIVVEVTDLFRHPTVRGLASLAGGARAAAGVPHRLADVEPERWARVRTTFGEAVQDVYPAARMQALMLAEYAGDVARRGVYHPQQLYRLTDPGLSMDALRQAVATMTARHPAMRTAFHRDRDGAVHAVVRRSGSPPVAYVDLRGSPDDTQDEAVRESLAADLETPFDPYDAAASLVRFQVFHRGSHTADVLVSAHHAVVDGWGNVQFLHELFDVYAALRDGRSVAAASAADAYREFIALEAEITTSAEARAFWRRRMDAVRPFALARRFPSDTRGVTDPMERAVPPELTAALRAAAARGRMALKALYLAPLLDVLSAVTGRADVCAGVVWNGRSERLTDPVTGLGLYWNLVPVSAPAPGVPQADRVRVLHQDLLDTDRFARYPLAEIMGLAEGRVPFFATFNFKHFRHWRGLTVASGCTLEPLYSHDRLHLPLNVAVSLAPDGEGGRVDVEYDPAFLSAERVEAFTDAYLGALANAASERSVRPLSPWEAAAFAKTPSRQDPVAVGHRSAAAVSAATAARESW